MPAARSCASSTTRRCSAGWTAASSSTRRTRSRWIDPGRRSPRPRNGSASRRRRWCAWPRRPGSTSAQAFDEEAIAAGLRAGRASGQAARRRPPAATRAAHRPVTWTPSRERAPVRVAIEDLVHRYPTGIEAVRGVSLTIEPGSTVAILGQNGSGKTTLAKHLNGLLRPASGRVLIDGEPTDWPDRSPGWPPPSGSSSRTPTISCSSAASSARWRSARATSGSRPRRSPRSWRPAWPPSACPTSARPTRTTSTCRGASWSRWPASSR